MRFLVVVLVATLQTSTARADSGDRFDGGTTALQFGGGLVGGAAGAAVVGAAFYGLTVISTDSQQSYTPLIAGAFGLVIGGLAGTLVTVKLVGDARDAEGGWGGTSLGLLGGLLAAGGVQYLGDRSPVATAIGAVLFLGGPVVGYQLQNDGPAAQTERRLMISLPVAAF